MSTETTPAKRVMAVADAINNRRTEYEGMLADTGVNLEKFVKNAIMASTKHPEIEKGEVSVKSCIEVVNRACMDGVELNGQEAALVIGWNGRTKQKEAQYRLMAAGIMKMIGRAPAIKFIACQVIYANDIKVLNFVTDECPLKHEIDFSKSDRGEPIGAYVVAKLDTGEWTSPEYMSKAEIEQIRDNFSKKDKDGNFSMMWTKTPGEAWRKTVLHRAKKTLPLSAEIKEKLDRDRGDDPDLAGDFIDNDTGEIVPPAAAGGKRQTKASVVVKQASAQPDEATTQAASEGGAADDNVIDAEIVDETEGSNASAQAETAPASEGTAQSTTPAPHGAKPPL